MKFSVLLPTRNRLDLLRYAVESVRRQNYDNWEIVISDNFSEDDVEGYVVSLNDARIRYFRTERAFSVTENWNNALERATGDYIIMLGDDDCLMSDFFMTMVDLLRVFESPELIYTDAYLFAYPGVLPDYPSGYLSYPYNNYFHVNKPYLLDRESAIEIVKRSLSFMTSVRFNMQLSLFSRRLIKRVASKGPFFQSLFPDFYATVVAFLMSERILIYQQPVVTIGISPKSYGFFHFNKREEAGKALLYTDVLNGHGQLPQVLPGSWMNTGWLSAMYAVQTNCETELRAIGLKVDYAHYRHMQIVYGYKNYYADRHISGQDFSELRSCMRPIERSRYDLFVGLPLRLIGLMPPRTRKALLELIRRLTGRKNILAHGKDHISGLRTIQDVYDKFPAHLQ